MSESKRLIFKLLSLLLQYPDDCLRSALSDMEEFSGGLPERSSGHIFRFLSYLRTTPSARAQECYTQTFDLSDQTCLYLTWHRWGQGKERGADLARLLRIYLDAGFQCVSNDLPDFLPMVLEFASVCPDDSGALVLQEFNPEIEKLHMHLQKSGSPYTGLLSLLSEAAGEPQNEEIRRKDELG